MTPKPERKRHIRLEARWIPRTNKVVPMLRLGGHYLADAGFQIGEYVVVSVRRGVILITLALHPPFKNELKRRQKPRTKQIRPKRTWDPALLEKKRPES